jgi:glycosyltransferase involved in cell wall biosynthesis
MAPKKNKQPFVSVCTPTYNRRPFIEIMFQMFRNQTYPKNRIEWIIVDDGTDKIRDLVEKSGITQIKYYELPEKITLGAKRNLMHKYTSGDKDSIIVYMDDDDYYMPERIAHAVEKLVQNPNVLCAGSSEIYIFYKHIQKMYQAGPYGPNHATAGTFAFRKRLLDDHSYEDAACLAEEKSFLKNYTVPFVQLDPMKTILVFSHNQNTFDKKKLLANPHPQYFKESPKTVDMFVRQPTETGIRKYFMEDIDEILRNYAPGDPSMKPDVVVQMREIELERDKLMHKMQTEQNAAFPNGVPQIVMQRDGEEPVVMSIENAVNLLTQQHKTIDELIRRTRALQQRVTELENIRVPFLAGGGGAAAPPVAPNPALWNATPVAEAAAQPPATAPSPASQWAPPPSFIFNKTVKIVQ